MSHNNNKNMVEEDITRTWFSFFTRTGAVNKEKDSPEDIKITYAGCDITQRRPETDNDWRIIPNADPEHIIPDKNDLRWQQEKGQDL